MRAKMLPFFFAGWTLFSFGAGCSSIPAESVDLAPDDLSMAPAVAVDGSVALDEGYPAQAHGFPPTVESGHGPVMKAPIVIPVTYDSDDPSMRTSIRRFDEQSGGKRLLDDRHRGVQGRAAHLRDPGAPHRGPARSASPRSRSRAGWPASSTPTTPYSAPRPPTRSIRSSFRRPPSSTTARSVRAALGSGPITTR